MPDLPLTTTPEGEGAMELLSCPFCGGKAELERIGTARQSCIIKCEDCGCRLETGEVFRCGSAWNRRAAAREPTASNPEVGALGARDRVIEIARRFPRRTPAPGGCGTVHDFPIEAGLIWELDKALRDQPALAVPEPTASNHTAGRES
jgi:hypothetical protein